MRYSSVFIPCRHRVVIDEAHQALATIPKSTYEVPPRAVARTLWKNFHCDYRWYVSGTPFPLGRASLVGMMNFIGVEVEGAYKDYLLQEDLYFENDKYFPLEYLLFQSAKKQIYWRSTKESVEGQIEIPPVEEKIYFVEMTPTERLLYDYRSYLSNQDKSILRQLCAISTAKSKITLEAAYLNNLTECLADINLARHCTEKNMEAKQDKQIPPFLYRRWDEALEQGFGVLKFYPKLLKNCAKTCETCGSSSFFAEKVQSCNHLQCPECMYKHLETSKFCPSCAALTSLLKLSPQLYTEPTEDNLICEKAPLLVSLYGSKFVALGGYLQSILDPSKTVKVIIFSQYEQTLINLTHILCKLDAATFENQIVYCKGNINQRRKVIDQFNSTSNDSPKILLLSLSHSASGTHLPIATHIILVDPVVGSEENAKATDSQAIARAHRIGQNKTVTAVRFIVKDSVEQDDYEGAYGSITQAELSTFMIEERKITPPEPQTRSKSPKPKKNDSDEEEYEEEKPKKRSISPAKSPKRPVSPKKTLKRKKISDSEESEEEKPVRKTQKRKTNTKKSPPRKKHKKQESEENESEEEESSRKQPIKSKSKKPVTKKKEAAQPESRRSSRIASSRWQPDYTLMDGKS